MGDPFTFTCDPFTCRRMRVEKRKFACMNNPDALASEPVSAPAPIVPLVAKENPPRQQQDPRTSCPPTGGAKTLKYISIHLHTRAETFFSFEREDFRQFVSPRSFHRAGCPAG